jgi:hypothetical protein
MKKFDVYLYPQVCVVVRNVSAGSPQEARQIVLAELELGQLDQDIDGQVCADTDVEDGWYVEELILQTAPPASCRVRGGGLLVQFDPCGDIVAAEALASPDRQEKGT